MKNNLRFWTLILGIFLFHSVKAEMTLEIVTQGEHQTPIAVLPFADDNPVKTISPVVASDLSRSGLFALADVSGVKPAPADIDAVRWDDWRAAHIDFVVVGNVHQDTADHVTARFRLVEVASGAARLNLSFDGPVSQYRMIAHHIADAIFENITGFGGMFSSRIAYITQNGKRRSLKVADSDGVNERTMLDADEPIISPKWSPDGKRMAYVTFELDRPMVVVQTLATGQRKVVARYKGSNSAPAWTPDGQQLAVVLTKDGHSQIYLVDADGRGLPRRLISSSGIDTEPYFTADGKTLYFTSDRDGGPQIYRVALDAPDLPPTRLTYGSTYAVSPRLSPDGKWLTYVQRDGGAFHVMQMDLSSGQAEPMTDTSLDESPTFAPNGKYILYSTEISGRGILGMVSTDGRVRQKLSTRSGDVYEPIWGPLQ